MVQWLSDMIQVHCKAEHLLLIAGLFKNISVFGMEYCKKQDRSNQFKVQKHDKLRKDWSCLQND